MVEQESYQTPIVPSGRTTLFLQLLGSGRIAIRNSDNYTKVAENDAIAIIVNIDAISDFSIESKGRLSIETNDWISLTVDSWGSRFSAYFSFPEGFLSYGDRIKELKGSQNLNMTKVRGQILLSDHDEAYSLSMQGFASNIIIGEDNLTKFSLSRIILENLNIGSGINSILGAICGALATTAFNRWRSKKAARKGRRTSCPETTNHSANNK